MGIAYPPDDCCVEAMSFFRRKYILQDLKEQSKVDGQGYSDDHHRGMWSVFTKDPDLFSECEREV